MDLFLFFNKFSILTSVVTAARNDLPYDSHGSSASLLATIIADKQILHIYVVENGTHFS